MRTTSIGAAVGLALCLSSGPTLAQSYNTATCWDRDVERMDFYESPPQGGDNKFFTGVVTNSQTTNVTLLYPTPASLGGFPEKNYRLRVDLQGPNPNTGCNNQYLNSLKYFMPGNISAPNATTAGVPTGAYSSGTTYPDPGPTYSGGSGQSDGLSVGSVYRYRNWPVNGSAGTAETAANACTAMTSNGSDKNNCLNCLGSYGYWLNPSAANNDNSSNAGIFTTNFLRFYPTKWTLLSLAYKRLVNGPLLSQLREAVEASNSATGGQIVQKMLPQACQGQGRPMNQKLGAIDSLSYASAAKPIAEMLFNAGWYMGGQQSSWYFTNSATQPGAAMQNGKSGPCNSCSGDFLVLFSDGRGDTANPACTAYADGGLPPQCTAAAQCSTLGMGTEGDGDNFLDPSLVGGVGTTFTSMGVPGGVCADDFAPAIAYWMANYPMEYGTPGTTLRTYVVGIGDPSNTYNEMTTLQAIANNGQGKLLVADSYGQLEKNLEEVMTAIISHATSFSSAAITSVQTHGYTSAFIPRFIPSGGAEWQGTLARYDLFNEFSDGCSQADYGVKDSMNPNGNSSCYDVYLTDQNNNFVGENDLGQFVVLDNNQPWDGGWPAKVGPDGGSILAMPYWEAATVLKAREDQVIAGNTSLARAIYTVAPNGSGTGYSSTLIPFTVGNASTIAPLLGLGGVNGDLCTTLGYQTRHFPYADETACATDVIKFINGEDVLLQNPYNRQFPQPFPLQARPKILGDIFHSTPVLVTPPVAAYLCDLGVANQCVPSLYSTTLEPGGQSSYQTYLTNWQYRTEFVLVGSNDGMLHAFNAGNDGVNNGVHTFDLGTGQEMWAFIPPDLLPKLIRYMIGERHELYVDGTPMVRDVWVDGSGATSADGQKQSDEFHTVAIIGEREGGRHYLALDVTNPTTPKFLWAWPNPGTTEALGMGQSWDDLGPGAPPIGPIAEANASGSFKVNGTPAQERYILAVGGGFDPSYMRGRGIYFLDAWTGQELYRFAASDATGPLDTRSNLYPVAAPLALLDTNSDGLFDTAVVGDTGGQVWTLSMTQAGSPAGGPYTNWYGGRAFIQFNGQPFSYRSPFFQRAAAGLLPSGDIRVLLGSGDRYQIKDPDGGTCGLGNLNACVRKGCAVTAQSSTYRAGPGPAGSGGGHYVDQSWSYNGSASSTSATYAQDTSGQGDSCSDVDDGQLNFSITCNGATTTYNAPVYCDWGAGTDGGSECTTNLGLPLDTAVAANLPGTMPYSRFYSIHLFDQTTAAPRAQFSTQAGATTYDTAALTDSNLLAATADGGSASTGNGWYVNHNFSNDIDERTSSSALLLGGCVVWDTLVPNPNTSVACGSTLPFDTSNSYQADAITGAVACGSAGSASASALYRATSTSTYAAPQQPAMVVSVNATTGQVAYGGVSIQPGSPPSAMNFDTTSLTGTLHWLEVPRKVHECRHQPQIDAGCL